MRAIFIFLMYIILLLSGCASVEIVKEVTKATKTIENSVKKIMKPKEEESEEVISSEDELKESIIIEKEAENVTTAEEDPEKKILIEKNKITQDKKRVSEMVLKQKKVAALNLLDKTMPELNQLIGKPRLVRKDRQTMTLRYDSASCRFFVFMNLSVKIPRSEYYELRNDKGKLIDRQKDIEKCFSEIRLL